MEKEIRPSINKQFDYLKTSNYAARTTKQFRVTIGWFKYAKQQQKQTNKQKINY